MSQENVEILRRANALFRVGDWDAVLDLYHPDVEFRDLRHAPDLPEVLYGRESVRLALTNWLDAYDEFGAEILGEYIDAHPWVICDTRWYGKGKGSDVPIDVRGADACKVEEGMIVRWTVGYPDVSTALKAVALEE
jgi:ketosteroid isomerase-like protein